MKLAHTRAPQAAFPIPSSPATADPVAPIFPLLCHLERFSVVPRGKKAGHGLVSLRVLSLLSSLSRFLAVHTPPLLGRPKTPQSGARAGLGKPREICSSPRPPLQRIIETRLRERVSTAPAQSPRREKRGTLKKPFHAARILGDGDAEISSSGPAGCDKETWTSTPGRKPSRTRGKKEIERKTTGKEKDAGLGRQSRPNRGERRPTGPLPGCSSWSVQRSLPNEAGGASSAPPLASRTCAPSTRLRGFHACAPSPARSVSSPCPPFPRSGAIGRARSGEGPPLGREHTNPAGADAGAFTHTGCRSALRERGGSPHDAGGAGRCGLGGDWEPLGTWRWGTE